MGEVKSAASEIYKTLGAGYEGRIYEEAMGVSWTTCCKVLT